ncbi:helix-turn-helix transcriptional regulator [uncultured Secundilactobacillus sp.]|uniref:helix-turn-helix transcriptional regulator n=1 Tax=uncultured Secundilactobacillus sp. TaxID=2813935 RepID=UPI0025857FC0|nr:helix-turn-helix transcriptional regulator [uncultured Secundilactobacillus sp.]
MTIGEKLKKCRANTTYTQADIAKKLHLSRKTISGWETGRNFPDIGSLIKLSEIYKVSLEDLVRDDRMLEHFDMQRKSNNREEKIIQVSYWLNIVLLVLELIHIIWPNDFHFTIIPVLLIINLILYLSHFSSWDRFKSTFYTVKMLLTFALVFMVTSVGGIMNQEFMKVFSAHDAYYSGGMMIAMIISTLLLTISTVVVIFFRSPRE